MAIYKVLTDPPECYETKAQAEARARALGLELRWSVRRLDFPDLTQAAHFWPQLPRDMLHPAQLELIDAALLSPLPNIQKMLLAFVISAALPLRYKGDVAHPLAARVPIKALTIMPLAKQIRTIRRHMDQLVDAGYLQRIETPSKANLWIVQAFMLTPYIPGDARKSDAPAAP